MLNSALLLDSARPFSDDKNMSVGGPEHSSEGVPFLCKKDDSEVVETYEWHVLRVSYSRELKIKDILDKAGVKTFVPMMWKKIEHEGKIQKKLVPAVNNLCFVYWTSGAIAEFIKAFGEKSPVHFYWDRTTSSPLTIPEKAMNDFITISSSMDEDLIYMTEISVKLREGQIVKVRSGAFAGVEGKIVRIRKSRRLLVELPGMLAIASTYLRPENIEPIE